MISSHGKISIRSCNSGEEASAILLSSHNSIAYQPPTAEGNEQAWHHRITHTVVNRTQRIWHWLPTTTNDQNSSIGRFHSGIHRKRWRTKRRWWTNIEMDGLHRWVVNKEPRQNRHNTKISRKWHHQTSRTTTIYNHQQLKPCWLGSNWLKYWGQLS